MRSRRTVVYLVAGGLPCLGSLVVMFFGSLNRSQTTLLAGIIMYMVSVPLLFQAKFASVDARLRALEEYLRELACRKPAGKYLEEEGEEKDA
jgi:hypothetical protein